MTLDGLGATPFSCAEVTCGTRPTYERCETFVEFYLARQEQVLMRQFVNNSRYNFDFVRLECSREYWVVKPSEGAEG